MEYVQQNINFQKIKLSNLINNLINSQLINQEININNEIKKESELLATFLIEKQKYLINQNPINNNNINPFLMPQPNLMINAPQMNFNPIQISPQQIIDNNQININAFEQNNVVNIVFNQSITGNQYLIQSNSTDRISDIIELYRKRANDYDENNFLFNGQIINNLNSTLDEIHVNKNLKNCRIEVDKRGILLGKKPMIF